MINLTNSFNLGEVKSLVKNDGKKITIDEMVRIFEMSGFENWLSINNPNYYNKIYLQAKESKSYGLYHPIAMFFANIKNYLKPVSKCSCDKIHCNNQNCYKGKIYNCISIGV